MKIFLSLFALILMASTAIGDITQNPHGKLEWDCYDCHNTSSWISIKEPMNFKHDKTGFSLIGAHTDVTCGSCHKDLKFAMIGTACADCHADIHRAQFGSNCDRCHSPKNWKNNNDIIDLHASRGFPLVGVHELADCSACHVGQQLNEYAGTPVTCQGCHAANFAAANNPDHAQAGFDADCQGCHLPVASSWKNVTYQHPQAFALHGRHATIECNSCHAQGYVSISADCYSCHEADFNATTIPAHVSLGFPTLCTACHNDVSWNGPQFDHLQASQFALNGAHATILCTACHINNQLNGLPLECYGCHQNDFGQADNPNHVQGNFPQTCVTCHNENAWSPATFDHSQSRFPLTGAHTSLQCQACHAGGYQNTPYDCYSCHQTNFNEAANPNHVQNNFDHNCLVCHTTSVWQPASFDHNNTSFPLTGAHTSLQCVSCHAGGYQNTPADCFSCHQADFNGAGNPNHVQNNFSHDCLTCHSTAGWSPATFDHANTRLPLTGAHISLQCIACHANGYQNTPFDCYSCHANDYNNVTDPNHVTNDFSHDCTQCHSTNSWDGEFNHANLGFPLTGAHASIQCIACHTNGYQDTPSDCYSCHQNDYNGVADPNHIQNNFDHNCSICHSTTAWNPATFDHNTTQFPLTGAHVTVQCQACHAGGYQNTPTDCYSCHQTAFEGVTDPNHVTNNFNHDCTQCHTTAGWSPASFDHSGTRFPLTGAHISLQCIACHADGYHNTPFDCYSCHQADYEEVTDPNHVQNNFSHDCTQCHSTAAWQPATFDHNNTRFPLTGAHIPLQCLACHADGYQNTPFDCYSCHQADYEEVTDPNHVQNNFSHDCTQCHNTSSWEGDFNHGNLGFPLTGAHASLQCIACHAGGYQNTPSDCYSCHQSAYNGATDPNHVQNNFDHDCSICHSTGAWQPATFDHNNTRFPLTGAHIPLQCIACHANGYQNTPLDCYSCHQADYEEVTDPNHVQNDFSHDCTQCHNASGWDDGAFDHSGTRFPLTGAHIGLQCIACHANGYQNTPYDCYSCHQTNFDGVADPDHIQDNFSHDCTQCHNTAVWSQVSFDHNLTQFPLTGVHLATPCQSCHSTGYDNTPNDCYSCHQSAYDGVTDPNHLQNNFSHDCTQCHNTAAWQPATFDHSSTRFPLTGAHISLQCILCHANGYQNTPYDCYSCHQPNFDGVVDPNHIQDNFSHDCTQCHNTAVWTQVTFDHNITSFPLTGAHLNTPCQSCHSNGYDNIPADCYSCHQAAYDNANDPDHRSAGFPTQCQNCHNTAAWIPASWNHDTQYFPIYSGNHRGRWSTCFECHTNPDNFAVFECILCHEHNRSDTDQDHREVPGYQYNSQACYTCHPTGEGDGLRQGK